MKDYHVSHMVRESVGCYTVYFTQEFCDGSSQEAIRAPEGGSGPTGHARDEDGGGECRGASSDHSVST